MYKVFVDKSFLLFKKNKKFSTNVEEKYLPNLKREDLESFVRYLSNNQSSNEIYIAGDDPLIEIREYFQKFEWIEAAGGLVKHVNTGKYLFIYRNGIWDLPKGKVEQNESFEEAAAREVKEECGIKTIQLGKKIDTTFHSYYAYGKYWIKRTHWFEMKTNDEKLHPQTEEGITAVSWKSEIEINDIIKVTYPSLVSVIQQGVK